jgi:hypothetical protein
VSRDVVLAGWRRYQVDPHHGVRPAGHRGPRVVIDGAEVHLGLAGVSEGPDRLAWRLEGPGVAVEVEAAGDSAAGVVRTAVTVAGRGLR